MTNSIQLIVGLGNPGNEYKDTRHNAGFWWVDQLCVETSSKLNLEAKFFGHAGKLKSSAQDVWMLKPNTFMNASGRSVSALAKFYKIPVESILVVHDELDLAPGVVKLKKGGGHGGHNGLRDIAAQMGSNDFWRLRIGIGHPGEKSAVVGFVLHTPSKDEMRMIEESIDQSTSVISMLTEGLFESAMLKLHTKTK